MLQHAIIPVTPFAQNCTLLWCDETMKGAVVDPGGDLDRVLAEVKKIVTPLMTGFEEYKKTNDQRLHEIETTGKAGGRASTTTISAAPKKSVICNNNDMHLS